MNKTYLPRQEANKIAWLKNFAAKLPVYAAKYGVSAPEVEAIQNGIAVYIFWVDAAAQFTEYSKKLNKYKVEVLNGTTGVLTIPVVPEVLAQAPNSNVSGVLQLVSNVVGVIKNRASYTKNDGVDMGIEVTATQVVDKATVKPAISLRIINGGYPEVIWTKGVFEGIEIQTDKGNGTWQFLAIDLKPNYVDFSPLPPTGQSEIRRYRAIYIDDDRHTGLWSDTVELAVIGV
jgi:hypothetical protein